LHSFESRYQEPGYRFPKLESVRKIKKINRKGARSQRALTASKKEYVFQFIDPLRLCVFAVEIGLTIDTN
jgi:hypothetical protein